MLKSVLFATLLIVALTHAEIQEQPKEVASKQDAPPLTVPQEPVEEIQENQKLPKTAAHGKHKLAKEEKPPKDKSPKDSKAKEESAKDEVATKNDSPAEAANEHHGRRHHSEKDVNGATQQEQHTQRHHGANGRSCKKNRGRGACATNSGAGKKRKHSTKIGRTHAHTPKRKTNNNNRDNKKRNGGHGRNKKH